MIDVDAPETAEYLPEGQSMHMLAVVAPEYAEYLPEGQLEQVLDVVAPEAAEYLPLPQSVQADEPAHVQAMSNLSWKGTYEYYLSPG